MSDKISDSLIDEILDDLKAKNLNDDSEEIYSIDDIDSLLAEIGGTDLAMGSYSSAYTSVPSTEKAEAVKTKRAESAFSFDMSRITDFDDEEDESFVVENEAEEETVVSVDDDGQLGFADDITDNEAEKIETAEAPEKEENDDAIDRMFEETDDSDEVESVTGQISIEKTRMFNEVDIRGAYNPNISHNLGNRVARATVGDAQPVHSSTMEDEKYRKHFMNKPVQKIENTMEQRAIRMQRPQGPIETPGVVVKNSGAEENTDGLRPMPTIISAEYELEQEKTKDNFGTRVISVEKADNQIMFDGFGEDEEIMQQSEEQTEKELRENRKAAVKEFVNGGMKFKEGVESPPVRRRYERQKVSVVREYFGPKDKDAVKKVFFMEKQAIIIKLAVVSIIAFLMTVLSFVAGMENGNFEIYGNNEFVYTLVQLLLLITASAINYKSFIEAINNIKSRILNVDTVVAVSAAAGFIQCLTAFGFADSVESVARLTTGAAVIPMVMKLIGELVRCKNDSDNFNVITNDPENCYSVENIPDEDTANEIARGLMLGNPEIKYSAKIGFPQKFVELSRLSEVTGPICKITIPVMAVVGLVLAVVAVVKTGNLFAGVSIFTATLLMTLPCSAGLLSAVNLRATNRLLNEDEAVINGYSAVDDAVNTNGVIIDACDAFEQGGCNIEGMKTYHKMRIDEAILYTASVVIASGGVMAEVFDGVIIGKRELLFPVESLAYEEKLGCSCWIHNYRVLVGNRDLLVHHNVETPDKDLEEKFKSNGRNVIYLAIEGKIAAMFVVVYKANQETARYLRELEKDGLTIFFRTADANITEKFLEREFQLPANVVKIINPVAGDMFTKVKARVADRSNARILHNGSMKSMLAALHGAFVINNFVNSSRLIQIIAAVIGTIIVALFTFMSDMTPLGALQIGFYQIAWTIILSIPAITRKK